MKYSNEDIQVINVEQHVVERQEMYFGSRGANPEAISSAIAEGALILGANEVNIKEQDGWWFVGADKDWLNTSSEIEINENTVFDTIHGFPEAGVNWHRSEVMAKVFSDCCFTLIRGKAELISGNFPETDLLNTLKEKSREWERSIVFRFIKKA